MEKIYFEAQVKKSQTPIEKTIKALDIVYPNDSLGFLHAVYAKVDGKSANKNKVILAKSVKDDVPKLRFTQANLNHNRKGFVIGTILDAWVNDKTEEIEIVFSFFKSVYAQEWSIVEKAIEDGNLNVSFELTVEKKDVEVLKGGVRKVNHCSFDGVGLLMPGVTPAYSNAKVLMSANEIVNRIFENSQQTIFASAKDVIIKMEKTSKEIEKLLKSTKEDSEVDKKAKEALLAKFRDSLIEELGEEAVNKMTEEEIETELVKRANAEEAPAEEAVEEIKEEKANEKVEETPSEENKEAEEAKTVEEVKMTRTVDSTENETTVVTEIEQVVKVDDKEVEKKKVKEEVTYTMAQVEEKIAEVKAELEGKISEKDALIASKDEEINTLNTQVTFYKENAKKIAEVRAELGDYAANLSDEEVLDEDKLENAKLRKQLDEAKSNKVETASEIEADKTELNAVDEEKKEEEEEKVEISKEERINAYLKKRYGKKSK